MYLTIPVIISRHFDEVEAERAGVPAGKERTPEEVELELEKLLAPYDYTTTLNISRGRRSFGKRVVPNYGARFDSWDLDDIFEMFEDRMAGVEAECRIYPEEESAGFKVIPAGSLPLDVFYNALVTPDGRYHKFRLSEPREETTMRREKLIREHTDCLAVICSAHI